MERYPIRGTARWERDCDPKQVPELLNGKATSRCCLDKVLSNLLAHWLSLTSEESIEFPRPEDLVLGSFQARKTKRHS